MPRDAEPCAAERIDDWMVCGRHPCLGMRPFSDADPRGKQKTGWDVPSPVLRCTPATNLQILHHALGHDPRRPGGFGRNQAAYTPPVQAHSPQSFAGAFGSVSRDLL